MTVTAELGACLLVTLSAGWGFFLVRRWRRRGLGDRLLALVMPTAALVAAACMIRHILYAPFPAWNAARLATTAALARGLPIYAGVDHGVLLSSLHTPLSSLAYLPATVAANPTVAVILGVLLSLAFTLGPAIWVLTAGEDQVSDAKFIRTAAVVCFALICSANFALNYTVFWIRADNPAIGLVAGAGAVLALRRNRSARGPLLLSGLLAILAVWTKQTYTPALAALLLYVLLLDGWRILVRYCVSMLVAAISVSVVVLLFFPWREMALNTFLVPSLHPWKEVSCLAGAVAACSHVTDLANKLKTFSVVGWQLLDSCSLLILAGLPLVFVELAAYGRRHGLRTWVERNRWFVFTLLALVLMPVSIVNEAKVGGEPSSYAPPVYFLSLSVALLLIRASVRPATDSLSRSLLATLIVLCACTGARALPSLPRIARELPSNPQQVAYECARAHPGEVYFPWNPLSSLMAEGKVYHFEFAIYDRDLAGLPPSLQHFQEGIPAKLRNIAFPPNPHEWQPRLVLRYLPDCAPQAADERWRGWSLYRCP